ncbi:cAMP-binding protein [Cytophagales bacterium WSM2-2]|nr:cAMP-binding protein [Cytophagales bacterium WSM2-2]
MKEFITFILQFGNLNQQQVEMISKRAKELELKEEEYFSEAGQIPRQVGFIVEGIIRICFYNNKGEEITKYFIDENNLVVDINSFESKALSSVYIQAVTNCRLIVFSQNDWETFSNTITGWSGMVNKITSKALTRKIKRISPMVSEDATTRYLTFMEEYPKLANRIPLSYLASYLGITQSSLSRIRRSLR